MEAGRRAAACFFAGSTLRNGGKGSIFRPGSAKLWGERASAAQLGAGGGVVSRFLPPSSGFSVAPATL